MKKIISLILFASLLAGCSSNIKNQSDNDTESNSSSFIEKNSLEKENTREEKKIITDLNQIGEIKQNGKIMYTITATEVIDVTQETENELVNDTNYLKYYSNGQGTQAVKITLLVENMSGDILGMPYLDDTKIVDSSGITHLGGWKDISGSKTEFGYFSTDEAGNILRNLYELEDGESRMATSTVLLANKSEKIKFKFDSQKFDDYIEFELPIQ